jgi:hypothetical protein
MRLAKLAVGLLLGVLPGCVVIDARQSDVTHHTTEVKTYRTVKTKTVEKEAPQRAKVASRPSTPRETPKERPVIRTGCIPFVIPTRQTLPVKPDFTPLGGTELETAIAGYINELRMLIKRERKVIDDAHRTHLTGCQG